LKQRRKKVNEDGVIPQGTSKRFSPVPRDLHDSKRLSRAVEGGVREGTDQGGSLQDMAANKKGGTVFRLGVMKTTPGVGERGSVGVAT